ncbi:MAG TPA: class I SAM-dependent methyltransferase [Acidimicrobiales bacterium]|nr:class I SAM-dependent methyltransferase [Acidimicrobiales bacterium]
MADAVQDLLALAPMARVLDIGCGPGNWARHLAKAGCVVTGVDSSAQLLEFAREQERVEPAGITYIEASASDTELLLGETFDRILASMSLSDIDDLDGALANVGRLLGPNGAFVFSILHPCFPGSGSSLASWPPAGYYAEGWWLAEGHHGYRGAVGANHRTLSTYFSALARNGLSADRIREPAPAGVEVPMFLAMRAIRR